MKWEVMSCAMDAAGRIHIAGQQLLDLGWEPFAVNGEFMFFRRPVPLLTMERK